MPANLEDHEKRIAKIEANFESAMAKLNKINQTAHDHIEALEKKVGTSIDKINDINKTARDHIVALEKKFGKLEKSSEKVEKRTDPRATERTINEAVETAMAAHEKKKTK